MTTTPTLHEWSAPLPPAPQHREELPPKPKRRLGLVVALVAAVLAFAVLAVFTWSMHGDLTDTRANLADKKATLADTQKHLDKTKGNLAQSQNDLGSARAQLVACGLVVKVAKDESHQVDWLLKAATSITNLDYSVAMVDIAQARTYIEDVNNILDNNGYDSYQALYAACGGSGSNNT